MRKPIIFLTLLSSGFLISCGSVIKDGPPAQYVDVTNIPNAVPKPEPKSPYGNPSSYTVNGQTYHVLKTAKGYDKRGIASWYGSKFHGQLTSTREPYDMFGMTAASTELPLPTYVRVTDLENGRQVIVKVNDRGPFNESRILDLSYAAARKLNFVDNGTVLVEVTAIDTTAKPHKLHNPQIYLQIGSFANQNNADYLQAKFAQQFKLPTHIETIYKNKPIYQVQVGPIKSVADNDRFQKILAAKGLHPITVIK
jgi:rare lipoprotein A